MTKKYTAYVRVGFQVEFQDNGEDDLQEQAQEAVKRMSLRNFEDIESFNVEQL